MSGCYPDCSSYEDVVIDRTAIADLEYELSTLVDQIEDCLEAKRPIPPAVAEQLHGLRKRAELLFGRSDHS